MDKIEELVEGAAEELWKTVCTMCYVPDSINSCTKTKIIAKQILSNPNLALVIRDGDEVPLGVKIETHHVVLLKKALKEEK